MFGYLDPDSQLLGFCPQGTLGFRQKSTTQASNSAEGAISAVETCQANFPAAPFLYSTGLSGGLKVTSAASLRRVVDCGTAEPVPFFSPCPTQPFSEDGKKYRVI